MCSPSNGRMADLPLRLAGRLREPWWLGNRQLRKVRKAIDSGLPRASSSSAIRRQSRRSHGSGLRQRTFAPRVPRHAKNGPSCPFDRRAFLARCRAQSRLHTSGVRFLHLAERVVTSSVMWGATPWLGPSPPIQSLGASPRSTHKATPPNRGEERGAPGGHPRKGVPWNPAESQGPRAWHPLGGPSFSRLFQAHCSPQVRTEWRANRQPPAPVSRSETSPKRACAGVRELPKPLPTMSIFPTCALG